ncbi:CocE/NonD family hydrolase [Nocardia neocaledoniensis]|uniref:CocE/NonD family hydrolase n=1 Tax=Nocardia neocaledoniensis TaxID=236511 RepID=UPI0024568F70|nr:CocE/NonD family hydrolase [Nocardia neocaledoniensis]
MYDVTIEHSVPATMRDGTVLRADIYRPNGDGPWPVLLTRHPYGKDTTMVLSALEPVRMARRGFIVVVQDTRGRFASEGKGDWEPWTFEADDGYDTVRWAAALRGSNGSVGMFGMSYLGNTQWMAALAKPPELKAIAPSFTWSEPHDGLFSRGGAIELGITVFWSLLQGLDTVQRRHADDPIAQGKALGAVIHDMDTAADNGYWELPADRHPAFVRHGIHELGYERAQRDLDWSSSCRVAGRHEAVELPSLHRGGWYDIFCQGTLDSFTAMRTAGRPATLVMGPWTHANYSGYVGDVNFGLAASADLLGFRGKFTDHQAGWFARWLAPGSTTMGAASPQPELPPVLLFVMGRNEWREEQEWPLARAVDTDLYLRADGRLSFDAPGAEDGSEKYTYLPDDPVPTTGGAILMTEDFRPGPVDQARVEAREDVLVFTSDPMSEDVEVTGRVRAFIHAMTDAPTTDWVVRLCDVDTNGVSWNVVDGIVRATEVAGKFTEQAVDLWSTSYVFRAGHRIRVHVTSSNFPRWDRNFNTAEPAERESDSQVARQEVAHDAARPSRLVLPIIPAS